MHAVQVGSVLPSFAPLSWKVERLHKSKKVHVHVAISEVDPHEAIFLAQSYCSRHVQNQKRIELSDI